MSGTFMRVSLPRYQLLNAHNSSGLFPVTSVLYICFTFTLSGSVPRHLQFRISLFGREGGGEGSGTLNSDRFSGSVLTYFIFGVPCQK